MKAFGTVEAGHDLSRLLFLEAAFAGVAVDQIGLFAQGRPLGRGGVVCLVFDHVLLARVDADRLGLDTCALGSLGLCAGAERAQQALGVGEIFEGQKRRLIELAGMEMEFVVLDVEDIAAHTVAIAVAGLFRQLLEELGIRDVALGYTKMMALGGRHDRFEAVGRGDLLGYFGIENTRRGFLPDLLVFLSGQLEAFVVGFDTDGGVAVFWEVVIDILDDRLLAGREITHITEPGNDLVAFLEQRIVDELQVAVGHRQFEDIQLLLVVCEDERGDLLGDVLREVLPLDLNQKCRPEGIQIHALLRRFAVPCLLTGRHGEVSGGIKL